MPASNKTMIHRLQMAINQKGEKILIDKSQFFSEDQNRPVSLYKVSKAILADNGKTKKEKLFETASQIQVVLFLRDYWYNMNGMEIPKDNAEWNKIKESKGIVFNEKKRKE